MIPGNLHRFRIGRRLKFIQHFTQRRPLQHPLDVGRIAEREQAFRNVLQDLFFRVRAELDARQTDMNFHHIFPC